MSSHASFDGKIVRINHRLEDYEPLPDGATLVALTAKMVRSGGHYANAPTCTLWRHADWGYIASDMLPPAKT